jgi:hypothetical protein
MDTPTDKLPPGVRSETVTLFDKDGRPTNDRAKAESGEIAQTMDDGHVKHILIGRSSK